MYIYKIINTMYMLCMYKIQLNIFLTQVMK